MAILMLSGGSLANAEYLRLKFSNECLEIHHSIFLFKLDSFSAVRLLGLPRSTRLVGFSFILFVFAFIVLSYLLGSYYCHALDQILDMRLQPLLAESQLLDLDDVQGAGACGHGRCCLLAA